MTKMKLNSTVRYATIAVIAVLGSVYMLTGTSAPAANSPAGIDANGPLPRGVVQGITKASNQSDLSFAGPGVVKTVNVKVGDVVVADKTLLAKQDDIAERAALATTIGEIATAELNIKASEADLEKKKVDLKRQELLYSDAIKADPNFTNADLDEARVQVKIGEISIDFHKSKKKEAELKRDSDQVRIQLKQMLAPISGVVAKVDLHPGEGTDMTKPAGIQVVQNDPIWVEVQVPVKYDNLRIGQTLDVKYVDKGDWMPAKVLVLAPVANAGANSRMVRLEMPNKDQRASGLQVLVKVADEPVAGAK